MLTLSMRKKFPVVGLATVLAVAGMPGLGETQTAPPPNTAQTREKKK